MPIILSYPNIFHAKMFWLALSYTHTHIPNELAYTLQETKNV